MFALFLNVLALLLKSIIAFTQLGGGGYCQSENMLYSVPTSDKTVLASEVREYVTFLCSPSSASKQG